jgi:hypothetical protein
MNLLDLVRDIKNNLSNFINELGFIKVSFRGRLDLVRFSALIQKLDVFMNK